jgi:hypothetical protein
VTLALELTRKRPIFLRQRRRQKMKVIRGVAMVVIVAMMSFVAILYVDARERTAATDAPADHATILPASR